MDTDVALSLVSDLAARYSFAIDRRDQDALRDCFHPTAVLLVGGVAQSEGADVIAERLCSRAPVGVLHLVSTVTVRPDADRWRSTAYFQLFDSTTGARTGLGAYDDLVDFDDARRPRYLARDVTYLWRPDA